MRLDVNMEFKRSILSGIAMACATVALCVKAISPGEWSAAMAVAFGSYTAIRTGELIADRKAANGYDAKILAGQRPGTVYKPQGL